MSHCHRSMCGGLNPLDCTCGCEACISQRTLDTFSRHTPYLKPQAPRTKAVIIPTFWQSATDTSRYVTGVADTDTVIQAVLFSPPIKGDWLPVLEKITSISIEAERCTWQLGALQLWEPLDGSLVFLRLRHKLLQPLRLRCGAYVTVQVHFRANVKPVKGITIELHGTEMNP